MWRRLILAISTALSCCVASAQSVRAEEGRYVAHVSSHQTLDLAKASLQAMLAKNGGRLEDNQPFISKVNLGKKGYWYRLRVGPLMSRPEAENLCQTIKASGQPYCEAADAFDLAKLRRGFSGRLELEPQSDGQNMKVLKPFVFVDSQARAWEVPAGALTDGASIPRSLWTLVGSPFTGKYLKAAIVHDYFVQTKFRGWESTHGAFYEAMLVTGVDAPTAMLMWAAVYRFGPRWVENYWGCGDYCAGGNIHIEFAEILPQFVETEFRRIQEYVRAHPHAGRDLVEKFIATTYSPSHQEIDMNSYPARARGYISWGVTDDENDIWGGSNSNRRYVDGPALGKWPYYGSLDDDVGELGLESFNVSGVAKGDTLAVRERPDAQAPIVARLPHDAKGIRIERRCPTTWCKMEHLGVTGFINTKFLTFCLECIKRDKTPAQSREIEVPDGVVVVK